MMIRLRFLATAAFVVALLVVVYFFVRSYRVGDTLFFPVDGNRSVVISSQLGRITFRIKKIRLSQWRTDHYQIRTPADVEYQDDFGRSPNSWWFQILKWKSGLTEFHIPLWVPTLAFLVSAITISPRRQFSLGAAATAFVLVVTCIGIAASWHSDIPIAIEGSP